MWNCPNCGHANQATIGFCEECGEPRMTREKPARLWLCENCGNENDGSLLACEKCGAWGNNDNKSSDNTDSENLLLGEDYI